VVAVRRDAAFVHEAFLYAGEDAFVDRVGAFVRAGVDAGEPVFVVVAARKIDLLRDALDTHASHVEFADMETIGANPGRIIPAWSEFLARHPGAPRVRGVGEPISASRRRSELVESQHHEALLNVAFADASQMWLVCPYDVDALDDDVIAEARHSHPVVSASTIGATTPSTTFGVPAEMSAVSLAQPLEPRAPADVVAHAYGRGDLRRIRGVVSRHANRSGLDPDQVDDLVVAVNEVATNSVTYGGGGGTIAIWDELDTVICELRDEGRIVEPLVGRKRPPPDHVGGAGLYLAHQFCDLVQLRSSNAGTTVRLHMRHR
jgi:anti-sigma regulatory factor (Ser/Thr protein kinase)